MILWFSFPSIVNTKYLFFNKILTSFGTQNGKKANTSAGLTTILKTLAIKLFLWWHNVKGFSTWLNKILFCYLAWDLKNVCTKCRPVMFLYTITVHIKLTLPAKFSRNIYWSLKKHLKNHPSHIQINFN